MKTSWKTTSNNRANVIIASDEHVDNNCEEPKNEKFEIQLFIFHRFRIFHGMLRQLWNIKKADKKRIKRYHSRIFEIEAQLRLVGYRLPDVVLRKGQDYARG